MTTGERIRHIRNERGISQKQLSEMCGLSEPAIRNYELGNRKPSAQILDKIAAALTVTAAELVLPELLDELEKFAEEGPHLFPDDMYTDQPEKQVCAELIREKLLLNLEREVPHGTAVEITRFSERDDGIIDLEATIYCEKASHKGIIIGKHGAMLKKIGEDARKDIEDFMGTKVFLQTWVKVKEKWRDSNSLLRNFGYTDT
mgnify:CR=1 FL=1